MTALKYYILIKISRRFISFWYYIEGNDGFSPLGEPIIPLSIYCNGTDIVFSEIAREEAILGSPCYYDDIFSYMQQVGTFTFRGAQYPNNKMLLFAIEQKFDEFFSQKLYGEIGSVQENRHSMPIGFVFDPELDNETQNFVIRLFRNAGYSNVKTLDDAYYILELVKKQKENQDNYVILTVSDNSLYGRLYRKGSNNAVVSSLIGEMEVNPKERRLCELIFKDIIRQVQVGYTYEEEFPRLMEKVKELRTKRQFQTGRGILSGSIKLSDGETWDYEIEACDIAHTSTESSILSKLDAFININQCNSNNCSLIVAGRQTQIVDLYDIFCNNYQTTMIKTEDVTRLILDDIKKGVWNNSTITLTQPTPTTPAPTPQSPILKRSVRVRIADIKSKMRNNDFNGARKCADILLKELNEQNILDWNVEIQSLISNIPLLDNNVIEPIFESFENKNDKKNKHEETTTVVDVKKYQREVRLTLAEVKGKIRTKDFITAESIIKTIQEKLHSQGVYEYDFQMEEARKEIPTTTQKEVGKSPVTPKKEKTELKPAAPSLSSAESLLKQGKFADAKRAFAADGNSIMAQVCSDFIKSKRTFEQFKMGLEAAKRNKNRTTISNAIRELERSQKLYRKYEIENQELDTLINNYRTI